MYLSGHPMAAYSQAAVKLNAAKIGEIAEAHGEYDRYHDGTNVTLLCILNGVRLKATKNNSTMAFVQIEDLYGSMEMLVFPKVLSLIHISVVSSALALSSFFSSFWDKSFFLG